jgi:hypothetical protein
MTVIPAAPLSKRSALRGASAGPFPLITLVLVIVIGLAAFVAATYLEVFDDGGGEPRTAGTSAFSRSAIGHRAFAETLRQLDIPVQISRFRTLDRTGAGSLLLLLEPDLDEPRDALLSALRRLPHALLVLPKWTGRVDRKKPIWIDRMSLLPKSEAEKTLRAVVDDARIIRRDGTMSIPAKRFGGKVALNEPQFFVAGKTRIQPILTGAGGILLGEVDSGGGTLWILSDPDLLSNVGIDEADNGVVAVSIVHALLPKGGTVIIDETSHGFEQRPNLLRTMLHPPFVTILLAAIAAMLVLVWAGAIRFGAPQPETEGLAAGKLTLVKSAAKLLRFGTSANNLLLNYRRLVLADAMTELHGPNGLDEFAQASWLDRAAEHRGLAIRLRPLLDQMSGRVESGRIDATRALRFALDLYRWKQEILHGTVTAPSGGRPAGRPAGHGRPSDGTARGR